MIKTNLSACPHSVFCSCSYTTWRRGQPRSDLLTEYVILILSLGCASFYAVIGNFFKSNTPTWRTQGIEVRKLNMTIPSTIYWTRSKAKTQWHDWLNIHSKKIEMVFKCVLWIFLKRVDSNQVRIVAFSFTSFVVQIQQN